jgi:hypothetical protein
VPKKPLDFDDVRELATGLPGVTHAAGRGAPCLKVNGKLLTCPALHDSAEPNSLVLKIAREQRAKLMTRDPDGYYVTEHYEGYPTVLVRLARIRRNALRDVLNLAWQLAYGDTQKPEKKRGARRKTRATRAGR